VDRASYGLPAVALSAVVYMLVSLLGQLIEVLHTQQSPFCYPSGHCLPTWADTTAFRLTYWWLCYLDLWYRPVDRSDYQLVCICSYNL